MKKLLFMIEPPEWVRSIENEKVASAVFAIIANHRIDNRDYTVDGLRKELTDLGSLSEKQVNQAYDLIISHAHENPAS